MFKWLFGSGTKKKSPSPSPIKKNFPTYPFVHKRFFPAYKNTGRCPQLCFKNTGNKILFNNSLTRKEPPIGSYIFVIRVSNPSKIYYMDEDILMNTAMNCVTKVPKIIHHDCLGHNENVICAGTLDFHGKRQVTVRNNSGHYLPKSECLHYVSSILKKRLGYRVIDFNSW